MIPKIIHYTWFSGEPIPKHLQELMDTWKRVLPDYEFMLWNAERLKDVNNTFANEAISVKKWAFAADVVRCYAVYTYGGIYLDTDVEVLKSFDEYLNSPMFIGQENSKHEYPRIYYLTSHCFGAEKHHPFFKDCMNYYENNHFIKSYDQTLPEEIRYDMTILPKIHAKIAITKYGYNGCNFIKSPIKLKEGIKLYPACYFDYPKYESLKKSICIHRMQGSWRRIDNQAIKPDYSITNSRGKGLHWFIDTCFNKINPLLSKYFHFIIVKTSEIQ